MKYNTKLHLVALATVFVLSFLILVPSEVVADPLTITETRISTSGSASNPDIYSNTIVWQDTRNGGNDVYMYDIPTKKETRITTSGSAVNPAIYGNLIVWSDDRNGNGGDIYTYDFSTKKETRITTSGNALNPDIYENKIVYQNNGISLYDLSTKTEYKIVEDEYDPTGFGDAGTSNTNPKIYGNTLAWSNEYYGAGDSFPGISMYDHNTKKISDLGGGGNDYSCSSPDINNNRIVWDEWEYNYSSQKDDDNICVYDFSNEKETYINTLPGLQTPAIYSNRIVWGNSMYDLATKSETKFTTSGSATNPRIYGDKIVWQDSRNGGSDIYLGTLSSSSNPLVANFSASPTSGNAPLIVNFTDKSTGSPISWQWTFGDSASSTEQNPVHTYTKSGNYSVVLRVWNKSAGSSVTKSNYISVTNPVADFSASPTYGKAPLTVNFKDNSIGMPNCWYWNFGDGTSSNLQNPVHKYNKTGNYTVMLRVWSGSAMSSVTKSNFISVISPPVAAFYATPISGKAPLTVKFIDKSTGLPKSWKWDFGDGSTSDLQSPTHTYTVGGYRKYYTVSLTVQNEAGINTKKTYNYISVS